MLMVYFDLFLWNMEANPCSVSMVELGSHPSKFSTCVPSASQILTRIDSLGPRVVLSVYMNLINMEDKQ